MALKKTTVLPDDPSAAAKFETILKTVPAVLMVIRGVPTDARVELADKLAGGPNVFRRVVWAKNPAHIDPILDALPAAPGVKHDPDTAALFISFIDVINGTIQTFDEFTKASISIGFMEAQVAVGGLPQP